MISRMFRPQPDLPMKLVDYVAAETRIIFAWLLVRVVHDAPDLSQKSQIAYAVLRESISHTESTVEHSTKGEGKVRWSEL
jgi:hypothetical protein